MTYLTEKELAAKIGRSVHTLRRDRCYHRGIPFIKLQGSVIYCWETVEQFLKEKEVRPEN